MPHVSEATLPPKAKERPYVDRRSIPNPEKNLKISVRRSFEWSKRSGRSADEARTQAVAIVEKSAKTLGFKRIPVKVVEYIHAMANTYGHLKTGGRT
jgi:hypothetical protein